MAQHLPDGIDHRNGPHPLRQSPPVAEQLPAHFTGQCRQLPGQRRRKPPVLLPEAASCRRTRARSHLGGQSETTPGPTSCLCRNFFYRNFRHTNRPRGFSSRILHQAAKPGVFLTPLRQTYRPTFPSPGRDIRLAASCGISLALPRQTLGLPRELAGLAFERPLILSIAVRPALLMLKASMTKRNILITPLFFRFRYYIRRQRREKGCTRRTILPKI